jgi:hypothetical protein
MEPEKRRGFEILVQRRIGTEEDHHDAGFFDGMVWWLLMNVTPMLEIPLASV